MPELAGGGLGFRFDGFTENYVNAVLWELPENGSDVAHLPALHAGFIVPALGWAFSHWWDASWTPRPKSRDAAGGAGGGGAGSGDATGEPPAGNGVTASGPLVDINVQEAIMLFSRRLPGEVSVDIVQAGPSQVFLHMHTPVGSLVVVETVTPEAPLRQRVLHAVYCPRWMPRLMGKAILWATLTQFEKDVPIWCAKRFEPRPVLSKADRGIPSYRRWVGQFYGSGSISFEEAVRQHAADAMGLPADASSASSSSSLEW